MRLSVYQHVAVPGLVRSKPDPSKEIHELTLGEKPVELRHDTRQHADSAPPPVHPSEKLRRDPRRVEPVAPMLFTLLPCRLHLPSAKDTHEALRRGLCPDTCI